MLHSSLCFYFENHEHSLIKFSVLFYNNSCTLFILVAVLIAVGNFAGTAPDIEKIEGPYPTVVTQSSGRKVYVVTAYAYTKYLGYLRLTFDDNGEVVKSDSNPILVTESFKPGK